MEIELGLKITKTRHDITSISDFHFSKGRGGPVFLSKQTQSKFILYAHLKGYTGENIEIKISEDGKEIWVSGQRAVQEMTMMPLRMKEEEVKMRGFRRKFKIPEVVHLDSIKASYDEDGCALTIVMPKKEKGVNRGIGIEELEEEEKKEEVDARGEKTEQSVEEEVKEEEKEKVDTKDNISEEGDQKGVVEEKKEEKEEEEVDGREEEANQRRVEEEEQEVKEKEEEREEGEEQSVGDEVSQKTHEEEETKQEEEEREPWKPSPPMLVGGSTLLASLLYLVIYYLRLRKD